MFVFGYSDPNTGIDQSEHAYSDPNTGIDHGQSEHA